MQDYKFRYDLLKVIVELIATGNYSAQHATAICKEALISYCYEERAQDADASKA